MPTDYATTAVDPRLVRALLAAGARATFRRLNFSIDGGASAREVIRLLVDHGADVHRLSGPNMNGVDDHRTALDYARGCAPLLGRL